MTKHNFHEIIERKNTDSLKYDFPLSQTSTKDLLPLWVADMDFQTAPSVIETLLEKSRHGIFGYPYPGDDYFNILKAWFSHNFKWNIKEEWLVTTPGVVYAICSAIRALTNQGDSVLIQQPVYHPFSSSILLNQRRQIINQLVYQKQKYFLDFADFTDKIIKNRVKLFILCNPHNPVGRVWTKDELMQLGEICLKHNVLVIADEIHADFIYPGYQHQVFSQLKQEFGAITITCTSPSKTFNLAGLQISNIFIENSDIRDKFRKELAKNGYHQPNNMGIAACKAAYSGGQKWLEELMNYLTENLNFVRSFLEKNLPRIKLVEPQGTYLIWLDFSALGLSDDQLDELITKKAGLFLNSGKMFGVGGSGFQRLNIACPRAVLKKALQNLAQAILENPAN